MKKMIFAVALLFMIAAAKVEAQVNVNINIGTQPQWGPVGYDYVDYYYLPDIDVYYNVPQQMWVYPKGNKWVTSSKLPAKYRKYNLYNMHKVVINEDRPYLRNSTYQSRYASYKGRKDQVAIRDSKDSKYNQGRAPNNNSRYGNKTAKNNMANNGGGKVGNSNSRR